MAAFGLCRVSENPSFHTDQMSVYDVWLMKLIVPHGDVQGQRIFRSSKTEPPRVPYQSRLFSTSIKYSFICSAACMFYDGVIKTFGLWHNLLYRHWRSPHCIFSDPDLKTREWGEASLNNTSHNNDTAVLLVYQH